MWFIFFSCIKIVQTYWMFHALLVIGHVRRSGYCKGMWPHFVAVIFIWVTHQNTQILVIALVWVEELVSVDDAPSATLREEDIYADMLLVLGSWSLVLFEHSHSTQINAITKIPYFRGVGQINMTWILWGHSPSK